ncbi:hypothetical protein BBOV_I002440 [Babesia bovis T2Bo]|uniref:Immune mapped protein 2 N-terminal domain-containing protein n=1 Tax=Babesia bovis TaxID=5865 RepID=A7AW98_BABBO|nr:hypothetical protein BBOV_I002440 [Babesia bovis T2Bo]EDO05326.1 hypothetical protein BBOV_I002440 [Babesia bovis T2Bo]BAN64312.1 hypothetical protein [Babesia bovis]|eukprot:XP_001608894.1 hypothetical protein [Babesia bovis T2Bo]
MGILDICCSCCSGDTVLPDEVPRHHISRVQPPPKPKDSEVIEESEEVVDQEGEVTADVGVEGIPSLAPKRPLKECRLKPGRRRITLTGAAAALPPCSDAECVGAIPKVQSTKVPLGPGAYLMYSLEGNGCLSINFAKQAPKSLDGVLAYMKPTIELSSYLYTNDGGNPKVAMDLQYCMRSQYASDRKPYYQAWCKFLKLATSYNGAIYLMEGSDLSPPPKVEILLLKDGVVKPAEKLVSIDLSKYSAVGVIPPALDYKSVDNFNERTKFCATCDEYGSTLLI